MTQARRSAKHRWCLWHKQDGLLNIGGVCDTSNRFCWKSVVFVTQVTGSALIHQRFHANKHMSFYDFCWFVFEYKLKKNSHICLLGPYLCCVSCDYVCLFACRHGSYIFYLPSTGTHKQGKLVKATLGHTIMIITNYIYKAPFLTRYIYKAPSLTRAHSALLV